MAETAPDATPPAPGTPPSPPAPGLPDRAELRTLSARRDGPALVHLVVQVAALAGFGALAARLAAAGDPLWWLAALGTGVAVLTFFPMLHEAGHGTAFATPLGNEVAAWLGGIAMLEAPTFFREFHWEHHRETQDPEKDPEIAGAPSLLDPWPANPVVYLGLATGQLLMVGKLGFTLSCALLPRAAWAPMYAFVRAGRRRRVAWESRAVLAVLGGGAWAGSTFVPGFHAVLVAWPIAHLLLGLYLMPEHTGLPASGSQLERTRTVLSNAVVRWLMWNMPYHAEHHWQPGVPFHAVPVLHRRLRGALPHTSRGYLAFHREALARALGRR